MIRIAKITIILLIIQISIVINAFAQPKFETAIAYNDFIVIEQQKLADVIASLGKSMEKGTETEISGYLKDMEQQINESINKLQALTAYNGNSEFITASISLFNFYKLVANTYYPEIVKIVLKETITSEDQQKLNELVENITTKEKYYDDQFLNAQKKFAEENNFTIGNTDKTTDSKPDFKNPPLSIELTSEMNNFISKFLNLMKENNQEEMKKLINPTYLEKNRLTNADFKINSFAIADFIIFGYQANEILVIANVWGNDETWAHELTFKIIQSNGQYYLEPGSLSGLWIDPWWKAKLRIYEKTK